MVERGGGVGDGTVVDAVVGGAACGEAGIATALLLAAGRAIGETMAVLMVCGNVVQDARESCSTRYGR